MSPKILNLIVMFFTFITLPILAGGIIRKVRARAQGRKGPPILQNLNDIIRLFQKKPIDGIFSGTYSELAPSFALFASLMVWSIVAFEWTSFILIPFFLVIQRIALTGYAMETGTSFGGLGTSREILLSVMSEPIIILIILVAQSKMSMDFSWVSVIFGAIFVLATIVVILAELARPPFDDPRTHLELTMVHEAMLLEASGRSLALFDSAYQVKIASLIMFILKLAIEHSKFLYNANVPEYLDNLLAYIGALLLVAGIGYWESICTRRKWNWVPEIMGLTYLFLLILGTLVKLK
ncbi:MAG: NADH-quinone oxidoreductase subunit H [Leptospiraceae bacterium]|nr:NADH-quinone oxidoreductase subunit H [Leptospiraceae bacterium]MCP5502357.1 NADH-quinone oxidoreductase subunit H [Leptospiraceae bacterium]